MVLGTLGTSGTVYCTALEYNTYTCEVAQWASNPFWFMLAIYTIEY